MEMQFLQSADADDWYHQLLWGTKQRYLANLNPYLRLLRNILIFRMLYNFSAEQYKDEIIVTGTSIE